MIRFKGLILITVGILFSLMVRAQEGIVDESNEAIVYFLRSSGYNGSATAFNTFIDGRLVCKLNNKRYSKHKIKSGVHYFAVQAGGKKLKKKTTPIELVIEPDKVYYFQIQLKIGFWKGQVVCQEITENSAKLLFPKLKEDKTYF